MIDILFIVSAWILQLQQTTNDKFICFTIYTFGAFKFLRCFKIALIRISEFNKSYKVNSLNIVSSGLIIIIINDRVVIDFESDSSGNFNHPHRHWIAVNITNIWFFIWWIKNIQSNDLKKKSISQFSLMLHSKNG